MKKYLAIGHWTGNDNTTCVAMKANNAKDFRDQLNGNGFIPFVGITEKKLETLESVEGFEIYEEVKKMTTNYRRWEDITEYIEQCFDIMIEKMQKAD